MYHEEITGMSGETKDEPKEPHDDGRAQLGIERNFDERGAKTERRNGVMDFEVELIESERGPTEIEYNENNTGEGHSQRVTFDDKVKVFFVTPYSVIYDRHPHSFDFARDGTMVPSVNWIPESEIFGSFRASQGSCDGTALRGPVPRLRGGAHVLGLNRSPGSSGTGKNEPVMQLV